MEKIEKLLKRLRKIDANRLFRRETEIKTIETVLQFYKQEYERVCQSMEERIKHLEQNPYSAGHDEKKKIPKKWELNKKSQKKK